MRHVVDWRADQGGGISPVGSERGASERTRQALIEAAEPLMARRGIDNVELREIIVAAGQRNRSAIAYHFGDRTGLVSAIGATHRGPINAARNRILDRLERSGDVTVESLVDALVDPLAQSLRTQRGRDYLVILAEAAARLGSQLLPAAEGQELDSIVRWEMMLDSCLAGSRAARRGRVGQALLVAPLLLADLARVVNRGEMTVAQAVRGARRISRFVAGGLRSDG